MGASTARIQYHPETRVVGTEPLGLPVGRVVEGVRVVVEIILVDLVDGVLDELLVSVLVLMLEEVVVVTGFVEEAVLVVTGVAPG